MCIHGDKSQPERDWVLNGRLNFHSLGLVTFRYLHRMIVTLIVVITRVK